MLHVIGQQSENLMQNMSRCLISSHFGHIFFVQNKPRMNTLCIKDKKYNWVYIYISIYNTQGCCFLTLWRHPVADTGTSGTRSSVHFQSAAQAGRRVQ